MATLRHVSYGPGGFDDQHPNGNVVTDVVIEVADVDGGGPDFAALAAAVADSTAIDAKTKSGIVDALQGRRSRSR